MTDIRHHHHRRHVRRPDRRAGRRRRASARSSSGCATISWRWAAPPASFACQAAKLGLRVGILGRVGDDAYGELVLRRLRESGVDTRWVQRGRRRSRRAWAWPSAAPTATAPSSPMAAASTPSIPTTSPTPSCAARGTCTMAATTCRPTCCRRCRRSCAARRRLGLTVSLDTNWDPEESLGRRPGRSRWRRPTSSCPTSKRRGPSPARRSGEALDDAAAARAARGGQAGRAGRARWQGRRAADAPVEPVEPLDTIGAGDSFDAGFVAGWLRGWPLADCAAIGNACGRATTLARGGLTGQIRAQLESSGSGQTF